MKFKNDNFKHARGGHSKFLDILCSKCNSHIAYYQKDGPGVLKRMYIDRIIGLNVNGTNLECGKCEQLLGIKSVYEKENRLAIRMFVGAVGKKVVSNKTVEV